MEIKKKHCDYHGKECYIWKNYKGKKYCKEGWQKIQKMDRDNEVQEEISGSEEENDKEKIQDSRQKDVQQTLQKRLKVKKNDDVKLQIELLDKLVRTYLLLTRPSKCFTCDYTPVDKRELQVGHYISRKVMSLRWDLQNVELQCEECNYFKNGNILVYTEKINKYDRLSYLHMKQREVYKLSKSDLQNQITNLKQLIQNVSTP